MLFRLAVIGSLFMGATLGNIEHGMGHAQRAHAHVARAALYRELVDVTVGAHIEKRGFSGTFTNFAPGLGACGKDNGPNDFIVAMNTPQYKQSDCFKMITITANGKTTQAQIVDECPTCAWGFLDLSPGLFKFFDSNLADGVVQGSWNYGGAEAPQPKPKPTPSPSPKPSPKPTPSSSSAVIKSSTKAHASSTTATVAPSWSATLNSTSTASLAVPSNDPLVQVGSSVDAGEGGSLNALNALFVNLGGLIMAASAN